MNKYIYRVQLCDGNYCGGNIVVEAETEEKAYEMAINYVCENLAKALPELDIEVAVELEDVL